MGWHEDAVDLARTGLNSGEITRELLLAGYFEGESFERCYERVRKYVRKHRGTTDYFGQNYIPEIHKENCIKENRIKFGLIGDTHLSNKWTQLTHLNTFYDICKEQGINVVYHCGDIDDGDQMRAGHQYELYNNGVDEHLADIINNYPKREGIVTKFITGNHDASIHKRCGLDIGKTIALARPDMIYLGKDYARVSLTPECDIELRHPWDGSSYAISQKSQKLIDNMDKDKPAILAIGHYHKADYCFYRGVHAFQVGCFEDRTPFEIGKNIQVSMGGWIVTVFFNKTGSIERILPEFIPFSEGIQNDYLNFVKLDKSNKMCYNTAR